MAGSLSLFPCLSPTQKAVVHSVNIVQRLRMRQLRGHLKPTTHCYPVCRCLFGKIPTRLGVPLKQIVNANALHEEGHVFLGFSKDGKFVLSYTLDVNADDHAAYPVYVYKLFWWRFRDSQPMQKVCAVRLFGEEEDIQQDLYLAVCFWPTDTSKVLVYGCCTNSQAEQEEEKKLACYVTITGVPSNSPCKNCLHCKYSADTSTTTFTDGGSVWTPPGILEELAITDPAPPNCLQHGFAVHMKYELASPFPSFSPKHSLAKAGVVVLNTGDSVIALAVSMGEKYHCPSLYSPVHYLSSGSTHPCSAPRCSQSSGSGCASQLTQTCAKQRDSPHQTRTESSKVQSNAAGCIKKEPCIHTPSQLPDRCRSASKSTQCPEQSPVHWKCTDSSPELCGTSGHDLVSLCDSQNVWSQSNEMSDNCPDWSSSQETREEFDLEHTQFESIVDPLVEIRMTLTCTPPKGPSHSTLTLQGTDLDSSHANEHIQKIDSQEDEQKQFSHKGSQKKYTCCVPNKTNNPPQTKSAGTSPLYTGNMIKSLSDMVHVATIAQSKVWHGQHDCSKKDKGINWFTEDDLSSIGSEIDEQCPYHHNSQDVSTQGSVCTIQECTCKLQGFAYSVQRYVEKVPYVDTDQPIEIEAAPDYDSMLPVVVYGTQTQPMVLTNKAAINQGSLIEVKQLTMDAEHYICNTIRTSAPWGRRYIAFTDYDMQILEVCPDSSCVIVMIMALIRATQDIFEFDDEAANVTPKLYETGFKFTWNLKTGKQTTFEINDLVEFNQSKLRKTWNPGRAICQELQKKWSIPQVHANGVHVITNEAVFKEKSLKRLLDLEHYVSIVLT